MLGLGGFEIAIIAVFGFLIFGPDKLPQIARTIGRGIRQFRSAQEQMNKVIKTEVYDPLKDLEPLGNPFAGFSLDSTKDASKNNNNTAGKDAAPKEQKKITSDDMKVAISEQAAIAKEQAAQSKKAPIDTDTNKETPAELSFAERRARLEKEHIKAKAAKEQQATKTTVANEASKEIKSDERKEGKKGI